MDGIKETCVKLSKRFLSFELRCHQAPLVFLWQLKRDVKDNLLAIIPFCAFRLSDGTLIGIRGRAAFFFFFFFSLRCHLPHYPLAFRAESAPPSMFFSAPMRRNRMETVSHVTRVPLPACHSSSYRRAGAIDGKKKPKPAETWSFCLEQTAAKRRRGSDSSVLAEKRGFQKGPSGRAGQN